MVGGIASVANVGLVLCASITDYRRTVFANAGVFMTLHDDFLVAQVGHDFIVAVVAYVASMPAIFQTVRS
jgi:hypothetical protein